MADFGADMHALRYQYNAL